MISAKPLYQITVIRRGNGSVILNYFGKDTANSAFARLVGDDVEAKTKIFQDDTGSKVKFVPEDIGIVIFMDYAESIEVNAIQELHKARLNKKLQVAAQTDPMLSNKLVSAAGPLDIPAR